MTSANHKAQDITTLERVARKLMAETSTIELQLNDRGGDENEVVVVLVSAARAIVARTATAPSHGFDQLRGILAGVQIAARENRERATRELGPSLPIAEATLLDDAGLVDDEAGAGVLERARVELGLLLHQSLALAEAARELGVSTSRLRQRLAARTLYGIKAGREWRIPRFQFATKGRLARNVERVLPRMNADVHPLAVKAWFTSPHQDLVVGKNEQPVAPIAWLEAGLDPAVVANLAAEL